MKLKWTKNKKWSSFKYKVSRKSWVCSWRNVASTVGKMQHKSFWAFFFLILCMSLSKAVAKYQKTPSKHAARKCSEL